MPITKVELKKLPQCMECKNRKNNVHYIGWTNGKYTCSKCTELAYHLIRANELTDGMLNLIKPNKIGTK